MQHSNPPFIWHTFGRRRCSSYISFLFLFSSLSSLPSFSQYWPCFASHPQEQNHSCFYLLMASSAGWQPFQMSSLAFNGWVSSDGWLAPFSESALFCSVDITSHLLKSMAWAPIRPGPCQMLGLEELSLCLLTIHSWEDRHTNRPASCEGSKVHIPQSRVERKTKEGLQEEMNSDLRSE